MDTTTANITKILIPQTQGFNRDELERNRPQKVAARKFLEEVTKDYLDPGLIPDEFGPDLRSLSRPLIRRRYRKGNDSYNLTLSPVESSDSATAIDQRHDRIADIRVKYDKLFEDNVHSSPFNHDFNRFVSHVLLDREWTDHRSAKHARNLSPAFMSYACGLPLISFHEAYRKAKSDNLYPDFISDSKIRHTSLLMKAFMILYSSQYPNLSKTMYHAVFRLRHLPRTRAQMHKNKVIISPGVEIDESSDGEKLDSDSDENSPPEPAPVNLRAKVVNAFSSFGGDVLTDSVSKMDFGKITSTVSGAVSSSLTEFWNSVTESVSASWKLCTDSAYFPLIVVCLVFFLSVALGIIGVHIISRFTVENKSASEYVAESIAQSNFGTNPGFLKDYDLWTRRITSTRSALEALSLLWSKVLDMVDACWTKATGSPLTDRNKDVVNFEKAYADTVRDMETYVEKPFDQDSVTRFLASYKSLQQMHISSSGDKAVAAAIGAVLARFASHYATALRTVSNDGARAKPMSVYLTGKPHSGKTSLISVISAKFAEVFNRPNTVLYRNSDCEFWDGYRIQTTVVLDDIFKTRDVNLRMREASSVIDMCNNCSFALPMSAIVDKSSTFFLSPLVIATSNAPFDFTTFSQCGLTEPFAFMRRWNYVLECDTVTGTGEEFVSNLANSTIVVKTMSLVIVKDQWSSLDGRPDFQLVELMRGTPTAVIDYIIKDYQKKTSSHSTLTFDELSHATLSDKTLYQPPSPLVLNPHAKPFVPSNKPVRPLNPTPLLNDSDDEFVDAVDSLTSSVVASSHDGVRTSLTSEERHVVRSISQMFKKRSVTDILVEDDILPTDVDVPTMLASHPLLNKYSNTPLHFSTPSLWEKFLGSGKPSIQDRIISAKRPMDEVNKILKEITPKELHELGMDIESFRIFMHANAEAVQLGRDATVIKAGTVMSSSTRPDSFKGPDLPSSAQELSSSSDDEHINALIKLVEGNLVKGVFKRVKLKGPIVNASTMEPIAFDVFSKHFLIDEGRSVKDFPGKKELLTLSEPDWFLKNPTVEKWSKEHSLELGDLAILLTVAPQDGKEEFVYVSVNRLAWWYHVGRSLTPGRVAGLFPSPIGDTAARAACYCVFGHLFDPVNANMPDGEYVDPFSDSYFTSLKTVFGNPWFKFCLFCTVLSAVVAAVYCIFKYMFNMGDPPATADVEKVLTGKSIDSCDRLGDFDKVPQSVPLRTPKVKPPGFEKAPHSVPLRAPKFKRPDFKNIPQADDFGPKGISKTIRNVSFDQETGELTDVREHLVKKAQMSELDFTKSTNGQLEKVLSCMRWVEFVKDGKTFASQHSLALREGIIAVNKHFWDAGVNDKCPHLRVSVSGGKSVLIDIDLIQRTKRYLSWPEKDLVLIFVQTLSSKKITGMFVSDPISLDSVMSVVRPRISPIRTGEGAFTYIQDVMPSDIHLRSGIERFFTDDGYYDLRDTMFIKIGGQAGYCGAPLLVQLRCGSWKILGFHCGGHTVYSSFNNISRDELEFRIESLLNVPSVRTVAQCGTRNSSVPEELLGKGPFASYHQVRLRSKFSTEGGFDVMGDLTQKLFTPVATKLQKSIFMQEGLKNCANTEDLPPLFPLATEPALLRRKQEIDPWKNYVTKLGRVETRDSYPGSSDPDNWKGVFPPVVGSRPKWRKLTFEEAVYGVGHLPALASNTASGGYWTFRGITRKQIFSSPELMRELRARVERYEDLMRRNKPLSPLFTAFPKDEKRPLEKVVNGETRYVFVAPIEFLIFCRMYFGIFLMHRQAKLHENEMAIGYNPYGIDWHIMASKLDVFDQFFDGDVKFWDGHYPIPILDDFVPNARVYYDDVPDCLNFILFHSVHVHVAYEDKLYRTIILVSGWFLTAWANSAINIVGNNIVLKAMGSPPHAKSVLGDDIILAVQDGFDCDKYVELRKSLMMWTTTAAVKTEKPGLKPLTSCSFLKRGFSRDGNGFWRAPLDLDSINNMLTWVRARTGIQVMLQSQENWNTARIELSLHPRQVFDKYALDCQTRLSEFGYAVPHYTYDQIRSAVDVHLYG